MFTATQDQLLALLAAGQSVTSAASQLAVPRTTVHHWRRTNPDFYEAVEDARDDAAAEVRALYLAHVQTALLVLVTLMQDPKSSPSVRLRAALRILDGAVAAVPARKPPTACERPAARRRQLLAESAPAPTAATPLPSSEFITSSEPAAQPRTAAPAPPQNQALANRTPQPQSPQNSSPIIESEPAPAPVPAPPATKSSKFITGSAASDAHYLALLAPAAQAGFDEFRQVADQTGLSQQQVLALLHQIEAAEASREQQQNPAPVHHTSSTASSLAGAKPDRQ